MLGLALALVLSLVCAAVPYVAVERAWRWRWREIAAGRIAVDGVAGPYRGSGDVPRFRERAPKSVRLAAFAALWCGQLFAPVACAGAAALVIGGLGLVTIPMLVAYAKLYRAGLTLLHRDPRLAYFRARNAADWSLAVHGPLLVTAILLALTSGHPVWLLLVGVTLVTIPGALLLRRVTHAWEDALFEASAHPTIAPDSSML
jgi:hypothetical protein